MMAHTLAGDEGLTVAADRVLSLLTIESAAPAVAGRVSWEEGQLPFPEALEGRLLERLIGPITPTPLADGIRATIEHFQRGA